MSNLYNTNAPKKPTNLTVNSDLLNQAKHMKIKKPLKFIMKKYLHMDYLVMKWEVFKMSQYCIYQNKNENTKKIYPYLIDVQTSLLDSLETKLVIPLSLKKNFENKIIKNLNPIIEINGKEYIVLTQQLAAIPKKLIGDLVENNSVKRQEILSSIDFLVTGF